jgi:hypothetical protein
MNTVNLFTGSENDSRNYQILSDMAKENNNSRDINISIPKGIYEIGTEKTKADFELLMRNKVDPRKVYEEYNVCMHFQNINGITIDAQGSTFNFHGFIQPFAFINCKNITVKNIVIDFERPAFTEGRVLKVKNGAIDVDVFPEYPVNGGEPLVSVQTFDTSTASLTGVCQFTNISNMELLAPQMVRIKIFEPSRYIKPNEIVTMRHTYNYRPGIELTDCCDVSLEDITFCALAGMSVVGMRSSNISFNRFAVRPNNKRIMSLNADATHFISCYGYIDFNNCLFDGMGDDAINVHSMYYTILEKVDARTLKTCIAHSYADHRYSDYPNIEDVIELVRKETLSPYFSFVVKNVEFNEKLKETLITFDRELPEEFEVSDLLGNSSKCATLKVNNCTMKNIRGRSALIQTRQAIFENCTVENCTGQAIHIDTAMPWMEAIGTRDIIIRNNRFMNCGNGHTGYCDASGVCVETECEKSCVGVHQNILIENNLFVGGAKPALFIKCAENVVIKNNKVFNNNFAGCFEYVKDVIFDNNNFSEDSVLLGEECDLESIVFL